MGAILRVSPMRGPLVVSLILLSAFGGTSVAYAGEKEACLAASVEGQQSRAAGKLVEAKEKFLVCAREVCPPIVRQDCSTWNDEVAKVIPTVSIGVKDAQGHDLFDVRVSVDGRVVTEHLDGKSFPIDPGTNPTQLTLHEGSASNVQFTIVNDSPGPLTLSYEVSDHSSDDDPDNGAIKLNGLPPGEPVFGTLSIAQESFGVINVAVLLAQFQPENPHEVLLSADLDGDGQMEDLTACTVFSSGIYSPTATPEPDPAASYVGRPATLMALPNPFQGRTTLHLFLPERDPGIEAEVFDAGGRRVRELHSGALEPGDHLLSWDARDSAGRLVPNGLYFVRVSGRTLHIEQKILRVQ